MSATAELRRTVAEPIARVRVPLAGEHLPARVEQAQDVPLGERAAQPPLDGPHDPADSVTLRIACRTNYKNYADLSGDPDRELVPPGVGPPLSQQQPPGDAEEPGAGVRHVGGNVVEAAPGDEHDVSHDILGLRGVHATAYETEQIDVRRVVDDFVSGGDELLPFRSSLLEAAFHASADVAIRPVALHYGDAASEIDWPLRFISHGMTIGFFGAPPRPIVEAMGIPMKRRAAGGEQQVEVDYVVLATGSHPTKIPSLSLDSDRMMDSTSGLELPDVPKLRGSVGPCAESMAGRPCATGRPAVSGENHRNS